jgi:hypothetical protein
MGQGVYALDIDNPTPDHPPAVWLRANGLHPKALPTRVHKTPSGGYHFLYRTSGEHHDLPTRQNIVRGLDSRGAGGWIAFGQGYAVQSDAPLAHLPVAVCKAIVAGYKGGGPVVLTPYQRPDPAKASALQHRWRRDVVLNVRNRALNNLARGIRRKGDTTRSARDHSLAFLLALAGWSEDDIIWALLDAFEHGQARTLPPAPGLRAAQRCAAKATSFVTEMTEAHAAAIRGNTPDAAAVAAYLASITQEESDAHVGH